MNSTDEQRQAAINTVRRSRLGDQNATATIIETRRAAAKGSARAKRSMGYMMAFIKGQDTGPSKAQLSAHGVFSSPLAALRDLVRRCKTPAQHAALAKHVVPQVGTTLADAANAAQAISQGPRVTDDVLATVHGQFGAEAPQRAFAYATTSVRPDPVLKFAAKADPETKRALQLGYTLGLARRLQATRAGDIGAFSRMAAWELGQI